MTDDIVISLIIPVYNVEGEMLVRCLDSAVKQTLRPYEYEIVVVDDCSDTPTASILKEYERHNDLLQVITADKHRGPGHARFLGVQACRGNYVYFLDGDDYLERDTLEALRRPAFLENADVVYSGFERVERGTGNVSSRKYVPIPPSRIDMMRAFFDGRRNLSMPFMLIRRELLSDDILKVPDHTLHEDVYTAFRFWWTKVRKAVSVEGHYYKYVFNPDSITGKMTERHVNAVFDAFHEMTRAVHSSHTVSLYRNSLITGLSNYLRMVIYRTINIHYNNRAEKERLLSLIFERLSSSPLCDEQFFNLQVQQFISCFTTDGELDSPALMQFEKRYQRAIECIYPRIEQCKRVIPPESEALRSRIVFVCAADYHIRNCAPVVRELEHRGHPACILDLSVHLDEGKRQLSLSEREGYSDITIVPAPSKILPHYLFALARLALYYNDFSWPYSSSLKTLHRLGVPTVGIVEGINDFLRVDFHKYYYQRPYRMTDYVFIPGEFDRKYFPDRSCYVTGLAKVHDLYTREVIPAETPLAVINSNFTYGVLTWERQRFLEAAVLGCELAKIPYVITQHPMDDGNLSRFNVSTETQYQLIEKGSIFISRFATGIIESLAMGKPAVYFNPHHENVEKFNDPMGAYSLADTSQGLAAAIEFELNQVASGVDIKDRAQKFLQHHANVGSMSTASHITAEAIEEILSDTEPTYKRAHELVAAGQTDIFPATVDYSSEMQTSHQVSPAKKASTLSRWTLPYRAVHLFLTDSRKFWIRLKTRVDQSPLNIPARTIYDYAKGRRVFRISSKPLISVIVTVYNTEQYLPECIDSLLNQKLKDIEIIIVNDGSSGNCDQIARLYMQKDKRIKYVKHDRNLGSFMARMAGYRNAVGKYIGNVDSDDYVNPDMYSRLYREAVKNSADLVFCNLTVHNANGSKRRIKKVERYEVVQGESVVDRLFESNVLHSVCLKIIRRDLIAKNEYLKSIDDHIIVSEDLLLTSIIARSCEKAVFIPDYLYYYRATPNTPSRDVHGFENLKRSVNDIHSVLTLIREYYSLHEDEEKVSTLYYLLVKNFIYTYFYRNRIFFMKDTLLANNLQQYIENTIDPDALSILHRLTATGE